MRVLQTPASKGYAETNGSIVTSKHPTETTAETTVGVTFGNNNEQQQFRIHNTNSNLECSTTTNKTNTTAVVTIPSTHQQQQQQQSHNLRITTTNTTGNTLEKFNCDGSLSDSTVGTALREHQNNFITETSALEVVDSLRNVDSSNNSFFEDCVNGFANLENYRVSMQNTRDIVNESQISNAATPNQRDDTASQKSGQSTPSFEEIHLDNFALERELNRIIRGTSISEACEDDNSCNCKSLQESLKSYELIRRTSGGGLTRNDRTASPDNDDDDYDDDQMDSNFHAETIIHSASSNRRAGVDEEDDDDDDDDEEDSLMDDDDEEYLSSQASSCTSVSTPQRSHFPRGIINPNYPGFQHLAHTLSEHYISHQSSDPYDSDLSEYEMELSVDSFECDFLDVGSGNSNTNHNNNNNLNTIMVINNNSADSQLSNPANGPGSDDEENNFSKKPPSGTTGNGGGGGGGVTITALPLINVTQTVSDTNRNTDDEEPNNLQTYLKLYDVTTQQQENERKKSLEIEIPQDEGNFGCPTPDILIKNYNNERYSRRLKPENRPDLLRNVSPNPPMKCRFEALFQEDDDKLRQDSPERNSPPDTLCTESRSDTGRDDISLGLTPVDIVGDFGEEVEREFGLIVSGYNSRLEYVNYPTGAFYLYNVGERIQPEKMSDALLSNGTEQIATSKYTAVVGHLEPPTHQTHHRMPSETDASTLDIKPSAHCTDGDDEMPASERGSAGDPDRLALTQGENDDENNLRTRSSAASLEPPDSVVHTNRCRDEHSPEKYIPTAIVKPKYQKSSYDERQLPPIGLDFNVKSRAWFDCPSTSGSNLVRSVKKSQNTERNSKIFKSAKLSRGSATANISTNNNNSSGHSAAVNRFGTVARRSGSSNKSKENCMVAVVPPMMKDPEELQHDEEHLDNKPVEPHCTRYSIAAWAASLRDSKRAHARQSDEAAAAAAGHTDTAAACFDVYNIETALPEIDLEAIESHLKRANEEERRRRNDREEIRRRLAMGAEDDYFSKLVTNNVRPGRKPSLQSRLQNGKNLQICFMNEASSDTESHSSDSETCPKLSRMVTRNRNEIPKFFSSLDVPDHPYNANPLSVKCSNNNTRKPTSRQHDGTAPQTSDDKECDFFTKQARLQIEARMALSQAKDMAHMQMELDRQKQRLSPITGVIRGSLEKVGVVMAPEKRRVSRQMLTDMNIAQLQIIVNDLHTQIEDLNDSLVHYLMERDDLHMGQDSMLVDIEDISRFLSAKELEEDQ